MNDQPDERESLREWHRLFGLLLADFFADSPFVVEIERDLSQQQQFLDVVIVRRGPGEFAERLPDGLEDLAEHNLITFKSHQETLDDWAMKELVGHYVAYRKLVSASPTDLLPEDRFKLYAVSARFPLKLSSMIPWETRQPGVYDCKWGTDSVRIVVAGDLPREPHNASLHLFSASLDLIGFGSGTYRPRSQWTSFLLRQLYQQSRGRDFTMYTMEDFKRDFVLKHFQQLFQHLTPEERMKALQGLPADQRMAGLPADERMAGIPIDERMKGLTEEQIRNYLEGLTKRPSAKRKPRRKK